MLSDFLKRNITSQAKFIAGDPSNSKPATGYGYGQVEPNHLSAQKTRQIYAQLPAAAAINILENGQFVKYDYAANNGGEVNFTGAGEWMLVFNEIKLYRDGQMDCEFAMLKDNYQARIYSPFGSGSADGTEPDTVWTKQSRWYNGKDSAGNTTYTLGATEDVYTEVGASEEFDSEKTYYTKSGDTYTKATGLQAFADNTTYYTKTAGNPGKTYTYDDVTAAPDMYEIHYNEDPFHIESRYYPKRMPEGTTMVPRIFKTNVGDIYTTNMIGETADQISLGNVLYVGDKGILTKTKKTTADTNGAVSGDMQWQVVKVYTMPDHQPGVKIMRIA